MLIPVCGGISCRYSRRPTKLYRGVERPTEKHLDIIWTITRLCNWDCDICCVAATKSSPSESNIIRNTLIEKGEELSYERKIQLVDKLSEINRIYSLSLDISGGQPIIDDETVSVIEYAHSRLKCSNISISLAGGPLTERALRMLEIIGEVHITLESAPAFPITRPNGYYRAAEMLISSLLKRNIRIKVASVLRRCLVREDILRSMYEMITNLGVSEWQILRLYPVGRALNHINEIPSDQEYKFAIQFFDNLNDKRIRLQRTLIQLSDQGNCTCGLYSYGLHANGNLVLCPWALNIHGHPLSPNYYLGNLLEEPIEDLLSKSTRSTFLQTLHPGKCPTLNHFHDMVTTERQDIALNSEYALSFEMPKR